MTEVTTAKDVGDRLAEHGAASHKVLEGTHRRAGNTQVTVDEQALARDAERMCEQQFGVKARGLTARRGDSGKRPVKRGADWCSAGERPGVRSGVRRRHCLGDGSSLREKSDGGLSLEAMALLIRLQSGCDLTQLAFEDLVQIVDRKLDAMVGDAPLAVVIGADLLGPVARADL